MTAAASAQPLFAVQAKAADAQAHAQQSSLVQRMVSSSDLLNGQKTVEISHNGAIYRLQATKLGKLILTK